jgi:hypothetical protein
MALKIKTKILGKVIFQSDIGFFEIEKKDLEVDVYVKVEHVSSSKNKADSYITFLAVDTPLVWSKYVAFTPNLEGDNFIKQAYLYLKTLPEYADAIDC